MAYLLGAALSCALVRWAGVKTKGQDPGRIDINGRPLSSVSSGDGGIRAQLDPRLMCDAICAMPRSMSHRCPAWGSPQPD
jgi:hypothetical protein